MSKRYGYVLLPIAIPDGANFEALWEYGALDLDGPVEHFHEDGGFAPRFVEAGNEYEAVAELAKEAIGGGA